MPTEIVIPKGWEQPAEKPAETAPEPKRWKAGTEPVIPKGWGAPKEDLPPKVPEPGILDRIGSAVRAGLESASKPADKPAADQPRRGGVRSEVKPFVGGDERSVEPADLSKPLLERPDSAFIPSEADRTEQSREPSARLREAAQSRPYQEAKPLDTANELAANLRDFTKNPVARGVMAGTSQMAQIGTGALRLAADITGADGVASFAKGAGQKADTVASGSTQDLAGNDKLIADVTGSIMNSVPSMALGTVGGPALRLLFAQSTLAEYNAGRDGGHDVGESLARAGIMGFAEAIGEKFGFSQQIKLLKSVSKRLPSGEVAKVFGEMIANEVPGEQLTTAMQFLADKIGPAALAPNATLTDYLAAAGETLKMTIAQTAVMGGGPAALNTGRDALDRADAAIGRGSPDDRPGAAQLAPHGARMLEPFFARMQAPGALAETPTQSRTSSIGRFDELSAAFGLHPDALAKVKQAAGSMPAGDVPAYLARVTDALNKRGLFKKPVDDVSVKALEALLNSGEKQTQKPAEATQPSETPAGGTDATAPAESAQPGDPLGADLLGTIDEDAHGAASSPTNDLPEPTDGQKEAGNYQKGHTRISGLDVSIENPEGSVRRGVDGNGKPWENTLQHHYGYIKGTIGNDGDHVDTFIKPSTPKDYAGPVFVIDQKNPKTGAFDEHKVMLGFDTQADAEEAYRSNYAKGWDGISSVTQLDMPAFKEWVKSGDHKAPFVPQAAPQVTANTPPAAAPDDAFTEEAGKLVSNTGTVSVSEIQRHFKVSYGRAQKIVEQLERQGIVSPMAEDGTREVLTKKAPANDKPDAADAGSSLNADEIDAIIAEFDAAKTAEVAAWDKAKVKPKDRTSRLNDNERHFLTQAAKSARGSDLDVAKAIEELQSMVGYNDKNVGDWAATTRKSIRALLDKYGLNKRGAKKPEKTKAQKDADDALGDLGALFGKNADAAPPADAGVIESGPGIKPPAGAAPDLFGGKPAAAQKQTKRLPETIWGSRLLAGLFHDKGGLSPNLLHDLSFQKATGTFTKNKKPVYVWHNPSVSGHTGGLFREGGEGDTNLLAIWMEEAGYITPGTYERDSQAADEEARKLITDALNRKEPLTADEQQAQVEADNEAARKDWEAGQAEAAAEAQAEREAIMAENSLAEPDMDSASDYVVVAGEAASDRATLMRVFGYSEQEIADEFAEEDALAEAQGDGQEESSGAEAPDGAGGNQAGLQAAASKEGLRNPVNGKKPSPNLPPENRLLLMPCSAGKLKDAAKAGQIYTGVMWQTFRTHAREDATPQTAILSAKHGFIGLDEKIDPYEQEMTDELADSWAAKSFPNGQDIDGILDLGSDISDVFIAGGENYRRTMRNVVAELQKTGLIRADATVNETTGGIGEQRQQLGQYLDSIQPEGDQGDPAPPPTTIPPADPADRMPIEQFIKRLKWTAAAKVGRGRETSTLEYQYPQGGTMTVGRVIKLDEMWWAEGASRFTKISDARAAARSLALRRFSEKGYIKGVESEIEQQIRVDALVEQLDDLGKDALRLVMGIEPDADILNHMPADIEAGLKKIEGGQRDFEWESRKQRRLKVEAAVEKLNDEQTIAVASVLEMSVTRAPVMLRMLMATRNLEEVEKALGNVLNADDFTLTAPTPQDLAAAADRAELARKSIESKAKEMADRARAEAAAKEPFTLTGSDRPADADAGQGDLLAAANQAPGYAITEEGGKFFVRFGDDRASVGPIKSREAAEAYANGLVKKDATKRMDDVLPKAPFALGARVENTLTGKLGNVVSFTSDDAAANVISDDGGYATVEFENLVASTAPKIAKQPSAKDILETKRGVAISRLASLAAEADAAGATRLASRLRTVRVYFGVGEAVSTDLSPGQVDDLSAAMPKLLERAKVDPDDRFDDIERNRKVSTKVGPRPADIIDYRKRLSVLKAVRECLNG